MNQVKWLADIILSLGNGLAYVIFGIIVLIILYFVITWGYHEWWVSMHCTMIMGTQVCK